MRLDKAVQIQIHQRQPHHIGRNVIAPEVGRECPLFVGRQRTVPLGVGIGLENVLVRRNQEPSRAAGRIENSLVFLGVNDGDHEVDDMARRAKLPGVALRAEDREQIFKGVAQPLAVIIRELVDDREEGAQGLRVAVGKIGIVEDAAEQQRNARVFRHPRNGLGVQVQGLVAAQADLHQLGPPIAGEFTGKERALPAQLLALGVEVVHEFVDERDGDLFHLALRVGHLADEDVAGCVNPAFGRGVEHIRSGTRIPPQFSTPPSLEKRE